MSEIIRVQSLFTISQLPWNTRLIYELLCHQHPQTPSVSRFKRLTHSLAPLVVHWAPRWRSRRAPISKPQWACAEGGTGSLLLRSSDSVFEFDPRVETLPLISKQDNHHNWGEPSRAPQLRADQTFCHDIYVHREADRCLWSGSRLQGRTLRA